VGGRLPRRVLPLRGAGRFNALLQKRPVFRSAHFALHRSVPGELSTGDGQAMNRAVDDAPHHVALRLGCVVPKRFARRAVTRNLVKRQIRAAAERHAGRLQGGDWLVRLRAPLTGPGAAPFRSAASQALAQAVRAELDQLLAGPAVRPAN
jgi:ribonuclease P protein component